MLHYDDRDDDGEAFCLTHDDPWPHLSHDTQKRAVRQLLRPLLDPKHAGDDGLTLNSAAVRKKEAAAHYKQYTHHRQPQKREK